MEMTTEGDSTKRAKKFSIKKRYVYISIIIILSIFAIVITLFLYKPSKCVDTDGYDFLTFETVYHSKITPSGFWEFSIMQPIILEWGQDNGKDFFLGQVSEKSEDNTCTIAKIYYSGDFSTIDNSGIYNNFENVLIDGDIVEATTLKQTYNIGDQTRISYLTKKPSSDTLTDSLCEDEGLYCTVQKAGEEINAYSINLISTDSFPNGTSDNSDYPIIFPLDFYSDLLYKTE